MNIMSQNIEIEFKNMLTQEEYDRFLKEFNIEQGQIFSQDNFYFDTPEFSLKRVGAALRIREKNGAYEMTLKQPAIEGLLETNESLSNEEASMALNHNCLPYARISQLIEKLGVPFSRITYFGTLTTNRVEFPYRNGLLVLDHSIYLNNEDFELEFEVKNYQAGQIVFREILTQFNVPERKTENKIKRFYSQKYRQSDFN